MKFYENLKKIYINYNLIMKFCMVFFIKLCNVRVNYINLIEKNFVYINFYLLNYYILNSFQFSKCQQILYKNCLNLIFYKEYFLNNIIKFIIFMLFTKNYKFKFNFNNSIFIGYKFNLKNLYSRKLFKLLKVKKNPKIFNLYLDFMQKGVQKNKKVELKKNSFYFNSLVYKNMYLNSFILKNKGIYMLNYEFIKLFKFKLLFFKFFLTKYMNLKSYINIKFLSNIYKSKILNSCLIKKYKKKNNIFIFKSKYKKLLTFIYYVINLKNTILYNGFYLKNNDYILLQYLNAFNKSLQKKIVLFARGRNLMYSFDKNLGCILPYKFTKYSVIKMSYFYIKKFLIYFTNIIKKKKIFKIIQKTEFKNVRFSTKFYIKKPSNKLIVSGRKKYGCNIYNNIFMVFTKIFKVSSLKNFEVVNRILKKLFIRASIRSSGHFLNRKVALRQDCYVLLNFSELKSRVNLFFFDTFNSLCRKKNKSFRLKKMHDLIAIEFLQLSSKKLKKIKATQFFKLYIELNNFMFKEFKFRGFFEFFRNRIFNGIQLKKKKGIVRFKKVFTKNLKKLKCLQIYKNKLRSLFFFKNLLKKKNLKLIKVIKQSKYDCQLLVKFSKYKKFLKITSPLLVLDKLESWVKFSYKYKYMEYLLTIFAKKKKFNSRQYQIIGKFKKYPKKFRTKDNLFRKFKKIKKVRKFFKFKFLVEKFLYKYDKNYFCKLNETYMKFLEKDILLKKNFFNKIFYKLFVFNNIKVNIKYNNYFSNLLNQDSGIFFNKYVVYKKFKVNYFFFSIFYKFKNLKKNIIKNKFNLNYIKKFFFKYNLLFLFKKLNNKFLNKIFYLKRNILSILSFMPYLKYILRIKKNKFYKKIENNKIERKKKNLFFYFNLKIFELESLKRFILYYYFIIKFLILLNI